MQELSLNILDVAQNSVRAGATVIEISVALQKAPHTLTVTITDNGCGMSPQVLAGVTDPFYTTRTTRKVGLGLPLFRMTAQLTGGDLSIQSEQGKGTTVKAWFQTDCIDMPPMGQLNDTFVSLIQCSPDIDFICTQQVDEQSFCLDTRELRAILGEVSLAEPQVALFLKQYLNENTQGLFPSEWTPGV